MNYEERKAFCLELGELMRKYGVAIMSSAVADDDTNLSHCIEVCKVVKEKGRWPKYEVVFECDEFNENSGKGL